MQVYLLCKITILIENYFIVSTAFKVSFFEAYKFYIFFGAHSSLFNLKTLNSYHNYKNKRNNGSIFSLRNNISL